MGLWSNKGWSVWFLGKPYRCCVGLHSVRTRILKEHDMNRSIISTKLAVGITIAVVAAAILSGSAVWATSEQSPGAQTAPPTVAGFTPTPWPTPTQPWNPGWNPCGPQQQCGGAGQYPFAPSYVFSSSWGYSWSTYFTPWAQPYPYQQNYSPYPGGPVW